MKKKKQFSFTPQLFSLHLNIVVRAGKKGKKENLDEYTAGYGKVRDKGYSFITFLTSHSNVFFTQIFFLRL
jgi:hypothetical protein